MTLHWPFRCCPNVQKSLNKRVNDNERVCNVKDFRPFPSLQYFFLMKKLIILTLKILQITVNFSTHLGQSKVEIVFFNFIWRNNLSRIENSRNIPDFQDPGKFYIFFLNRQDWDKQIPYHRREFSTVYRFYVAGSDNNSESATLLELPLSCRFMVWKQRVSIYGIRISRYIPINLALRILRHQIDNQCLFCINGYFAHMQSRLRKLRK